MEAAKGFRHRDDLLAIQSKAQEKWSKEKIFEADAPEGGEPLPEGKFFGNFPYPYMNGVLHLGHAFSVSKLEFAAAYQRLIGKRVLFPQGFHCTGMPIKACADRLRGEIEAYGCPPVFPQDEDPPVPEADAPAAGVKVTKKGKAAAKKGKGATQWDILKNSGIPEDEIPNFQNPMHWLRYFPPIAQADLAFLGCGIDWRRAFITTDANPYYDSFVRWQLNTLKALGKIVKAKRFAVYSPKDGQPCADHDRASGEGIGPQEYTLVKMKALELRGPLADLGKASPGCEVFLMAATLRPETMFGQTNCWVLPEGDYVAVQGPGKAVYVLCERAARNLAFQEQLPQEGVVAVLARCKGQDLIGTPLRAPNCPHDRIYVLPLLTILMTKGTGVVTSVPSDSPTDYMALLDLKKKAKLREKFAVEDDWVMPFEVIPIIDIPEFGDKAAVKVCEDLKIQSQNDTVKLEEAKGMVYLKGFNEGVMTVGRYAGDRVADAKPKMRQDLLESGEGIKYAEPEGRVVSRSGDECIVALTDQWYLTYGEAEWRSKTDEALQSMETYDPVVRHAFEHTLGWLEQWACSRSFGLGTKLPWDPEFLIESLSDSTIYMAYYTIAHILQEGDMFGDHRGAVKPEDMTPEVWDAIFLGKPTPEGCSVPADVMKRMKDEFNFWYPFDLRVSGKDLIQNHLTFCLYNHTAIFPPDMWPRSFRTNGHLLLNSEKMSKNTGNFKTLRAAVDQYSADATRVALADASDANDDGNFEELTANATIVRLANELAWIHEVRDASANLRTGDLNLADKVFANAISCAAHAARTAYDALLFRDALKAAMYDMQNARGAYRVQLGADGMHEKVVSMFLDTSVRMLAPICPHWCEHVWGDVLGREGSVLVSGWPEVPPPDFVLKMAAEYIEKLVTHLRGAIAKKEAPPKKKKADAPPPPKVTGVELHVADCFEGWRAAALGAAREAFDANGGTLPDDWLAAAVSAAAATEELAGLNEKSVKSTTMPFLKAKGAEAAEGGRQALDDMAPFDEFQVLTDYIPHLQRSLGMENVAVQRHPQGATIDSKDGPFPLEPKVVLLHE